MATPELKETEASVLRAVHAEGGADLYELARAVGVGPRTVQEAVGRLSRDDLVHVSHRGRRVQCTRAGDQWVRRHE